MCTFVFQFQCASCSGLDSAMNLDDDETEQGLRPLRGFRRRWQAPQPSTPADSDVVGLHDLEEGPYEVNSPLMGESAFGSADVGMTLDDWDFLESSPVHVEHASNTMKRLLEPESDFANHECRVRVLDPNSREPTWKAAATASNFKRMKRDLEKLPWEVEGTAFRLQDKWHGTALASFDSYFTPTCIGAFDVWDSQVVKTRPEVTRVAVDLPVVPFTLKRARREPVDEDIRCQALMKFRDIILQDPLSTQLGASLRGRLDQGTSHDDIDQSFRDCFRMKASSTLQKRSASLAKLSKFLRAAGQLYPLRLSEPQLYAALCSMREAGSGATSAQHVIEALHFLDSTAKLKIVDLSDVISARCRGVARDMYLTKSPLQQKQPLTVAQVYKLEGAMQSSGTVLRCILGQLLFCIHACCRWRDAQRLKSISTETGHGETLLYADALTSKTALTAEAKTRFLPYAAIGTGLSTEDWSAMWLDARREEGLTFSEFVLPSFSEKYACWLDTPMSASEATVWLREFLEGSENFRPEMLGSHSCKTTLLTWAGRSVKVVFTPSERRLLGHHLDPSMKSVLCYSRESYTSLYSKVLGMFRLIRSGDYNPDQSAIDRVVQMAEETGEVHAEPIQETEGEDIHSDSESSVASMESLRVPEEGDDERNAQCISLFPAFPGVPEASMFVHRISGLVHVANEDDVLICGRPTSLHFKPFSKVADREHLESCRQCLKSFQNRKA